MHSFYSIGSATLSKLLVVLVLTFCSVVEAVKYESLDVWVDHLYWMPFYFTNVTLGSQKQNVTVLVDTGSYYLYVEDVQNTECNSICKKLGTFDSEHSTTFHNLSVPFNEFSAKGFYGADDFLYPDGKKISQYQFAVTRNQGTYGNILGLASRLEDARNIYWATKQIGAADTQGYSFYAGDYTKGIVGKYIIGALDRAKYEGELQVFDHEELKFPFTTFTLADGQVFQMNNTLMLFDTGARAIGVAKEIADPINKALGADEKGHFPCSWRNLDKSVEFNLGGLNFSVPYSDFFHTNPDGSCSSAFQIGVGNLMGSDISRHLYFAANQETKKVAIAKIKVTDETDMIPFNF
ncbi:uncharacterized protein LODBEIA_P22660 [Lodderomyces beijingensis]|uniref:Peptidase A1 domain-containing protein n=1 Tax=Lodderomyces beijingensis TaxID=1775926 RepID=A0ABP0ZPF3_9ASCO